MLNQQTLQSHCNEQLKNNIQIIPDLEVLLDSIATIARVIRREVLFGALSGNCSGNSADHNASGDDVKKIDVFSNEKMKEILAESGYVAVMGSEEEEGIVIPSRLNSNAKYVVLFDPLDGSSNIDVTASVGTIFSIYKTTGVGGVDECFQPGSEQVIGGYVLYGSSTVLVYTAKNGVHGFTYHPEKDDFILSLPDIKIPESANYYSVNEGLSPRLFPGTAAYLQYLKGETEDRPVPTLSGRYVGALVADFHRNLLKGGVYIYPGTTKHPQGKLRLLYEANPLALICEQAGGKATNGLTPILEIKPSALHQKTPLYIGSAHLVEKALQFEGQEVVA